MNSVLNPEAPEFHPHLTSLTKDGYNSLTKSVRASNNMPRGTSYQWYETITDFKIIKSKLTKNIVMQSNDVIVTGTEQNSTKLKYNNTEHNTEILVDANDNMLDRIHIHIDGMEAAQTNNDGSSCSKTVLNVSAWNTKPVISVVQMGATKFIGSKNIPRPQWLFKESIDNSESLWVPKISDKPNNIKPLALTILYDDEGKAVGYEHPYDIELQLYTPPAQFVEPDSSPPAFPPPLEETNYLYVETEAQVDGLVQHLCGVDELAIDVEHHSYRTYQGITCLIQISTSECDFIVDALAVRSHIHKLNLPFTDPKKLKVFHGAEMDVLWLQRDFGVYVVGMFDTHQAARALGLPSGALKHLLMKYCNVDANKKYQLADWRIRPLPAELVEYARMDTHYLLYVWRRMKAELLAQPAAGALLASVFDNSRRICGLTYKKEVVSEASHLELYTRSKKSFNSRQMAALRLLYKWRDSQARLEDESTAYLLPNHMMLALAETLPREVQGVSACCSPMPPFIKQNLITLHRMLLSCRELPLEPRLCPAPAGLATVFVPQLTYNVHDLSQLPDAREDQINLELAASCVEVAADSRPDVAAFDAETGTQPARRRPLWKINADAPIFIPPYDRYRKYRALVQMQEMKAFKEKEAKIKAISKGNELIKTEVLIKLQEAKSLVGEPSEPNAESSRGTKDSRGEEDFRGAEDSRGVEDSRVVEESRVVEDSRVAEDSRVVEDALARKRKMPDDKREPSGRAGCSAAAGDAGKKHSNHKAANPYKYVSSSYKKFYTEMHKQAKVKDRRK